MSTVDEQPNDPPSDEEYAHKVRNTLNAIAMQTELAKTLLAAGDSDGAVTALDKVLAKCRALASARQS